MMGLLGSAFRRIESKLLGGTCGIFCFSPKLQLRVLSGEPDPQSPWELRVSCYPFDGHVARPS